MFMFWYKNCGLASFFFFPSSILFLSKTWKPGVKEDLSDFHIIQFWVHLHDHLTMMFSYLKQTQSPALQFTVFQGNIYLNLYIFYSTSTQYKSSKFKIMMWHMCLVIPSRGCTVEDEPPGFVHIVCSVVRIGVC